jgi:hypothetical protein
VELLHILDWKVEVLRNKSIDFVRFNGPTIVLNMVHGGTRKT